MSGSPTLDALLDKAFRDGADEAERVVRARLCRELGAVFADSRAWAGDPGALRDAVLRVVHGDADAAQGPGA